MGQFLSDYLTENVCRVPILGQISTHGSVEYLVNPDFHRTSRPMWADNLLAVCSSWGDGGTSNKNRGVQPGGPHIIVVTAWGTTVPSCIEFMTWSPESLRVAACCVCDDFRRARHREIDL